MAGAEFHTGPLTPFLRSGSYKVTAPIAIGTAWAIPGLGRQIRTKASKPVSNMVRSEPAWPRHIIAVNNSTHNADSQKALYVVWRTLGMIHDVGPLNSATSASASATDIQSTCRQASGPFRIGGLMGLTSRLHSRQ